MANKRMFSKDIVGSDAFQDMPVSSQLLYFHLGMEADDDGFIGNPKKIARSIGMAEDDMKILVSKRFVLIFPSGVLVIKHHRINNNWDKYNCKRTMYMEEFKQLCIKENKAYTIDKTQGIPLQTDNRLETVYRIEENRIEENRKEKNNSIDFNLFWDLYDKKISKPKVEKKWYGLSKENQLKILDYLPKYKLATPDKKFRKNPETFINNHSWEDELVGAKGTAPDKPTAWAGDLALFGDDDIQTKLDKGIIKFNQIIKKYERV